MKPRSEDLGFRTAGAVGGPWSQVGRCEVVELNPLGQRREAARRCTSATGLSAASAAVFARRSSTGRRCVTGQGAGNDEFWLVRWSYLQP